MTYRHRARWVALLVAVSFSTLSALAWAQTDSADADSGDETTSRDQSDANRPLSEVLTGDGLAAYEAARLLFADGDYAGALAKFKQAFELTNEPRLLWNMAVCEKEQRHYVDSTRLVERYLADSKNLPESRREAARTTLETLRTFTSRVTLKGLPAGAKVSVDGRDVGTTPLDGPVLLDLGRRRLKIVAPGYEPYEDQLEVAGNTDSELEVTLERQKVAAQLRIASANKNDVIEVDGKVVGKGNWEGPVQPGEHSVRVTAPGKEPYEQNVHLPARSTRSIQVTLREEEGLGAWPWVVGGAVVVAGAAVGGYFLFRGDPDVVGPEGDLGSRELPLRF